MTTVPFVGAGIIAIERGYALAGMSSKHKFFSGIGGKPEGDEEPIQTALREAVEEIFGIEPNPLLLYDLYLTFHNNKIIERQQYHMVVMSFEDISKFVKVVKLNGTKSPFYNDIPESAIKLIMDRIPDDNSEVTELVFLNYKDPVQRVDPDFIKDCYFVETKCL